MRAIKVGNVNVFPFRDMQELMDYTANDKKLLLSLNAEIIMKAEGEVADIINSNIGYADGYGAIKAMCRKGGKELNLKSASNLNGNLNCSKELEHYAS